MGFVRRRNRLSVCAGERRRRRQSAFDALAPLGRPPPCLNDSHAQSIGSSINTKQQASPTGSTSAPALKSPPFQKKLSVSTRKPSPRAPGPSPPPTPRPDPPTGAPSRRARRAGLEARGALAFFLAAKTPTLEHPPIALSIDARGPAALPARQRPVPVLYRDRAYDLTTAGLRRPPGRLERDVSPSLFPLFFLSLRH